MLEEVVSALISGPCLCSHTFSFVVSIFCMFQTNTLKNELSREKGWFGDYWTRNLKIWFQCLALSKTLRAILGKSLSFFVPWFPTCKTGLIQPFSHSVCPVSLHCKFFRAGTVSYCLFCTVPGTKRPWSWLDSLGTIIMRVIRAGQGSCMHIMCPLLSPYPQSSSSNSGLEPQCYGQSKLFGCTYWGRLLLRWCTFVSSLPTAPCSTVSQRTSIHFPILHMHTYTQHPRWQRLKLVMEKP